MLNRDMDDIKKGPNQTFQDKSKMSEIKYTLDGINNVFYYSLQMRRLENLKIAIEILQNEREKKKLEKKSENYGLWAKSSHAHLFSYCLWSLS